MTLRKLCLLWFFLFCAIARADTPPAGQNLQINTYFRSITGTPTWLLIIRDEDTGKVSPYIFDVANKENFWIAFTFGHSYRITASSVKFNPYATLNNFCGLENYGILSGQSLFITVSGSLTPNYRSSKCRVLKYNAMPFPVATSP